MFGLFSSVNQEILTQATVAFSSEFYRHIKDDVNFSPDDVAIVQSEFSILALSVVNSFIALRKKNPNKLLVQNTQQCLQIFGKHFEGITKGKVSAQSYAAGILKTITDEAPEYSHILSSMAPEKHPETIVRCFERRARIQFSSEKSFQKACDKMTEMLGALIDNLKKAGV